jgi:isoleucyl-tRNA synthetase
MVSTKCGAARSKYRPNEPAGSYDRWFTMSAYPDVQPQTSFPKLEAETLARWASEHTFETSIANRPAGKGGDNEFVFYDGPPFANGLPHYGHLLTGYVKDAVPRYKTMRGRRVERRFGWDCHGLPAEVEAEKQLGIKHRAEIVEMGVHAFNAACRESVLKYTGEWRRYVTRQARWVDFDNDYKTLDLNYMESVMWAFRTLYDKGLIYEGYKVLPYCWRCETPLSNTETRMDDVYRNRQDQAVTVALRLKQKPGDLPDTDIWIWTTTPWTLPSNLAIAVGPDIEYAFMQRDDHRVVLAAARLGNYAKELDGYRLVATVLGSDLAGQAYEPPFDYFAGRPNAHHILAGDFVTTDDGTGVVHLAPGFGEDDQIVCAAAGISVVCPVDSQCQFTAEVPEYEGIQVFETNTPITRRLREAGVLVRAASYDHDYPHCWRCANPLVYRAISSWFVQVTAFRDRMVELNQQINWVPEHVKDGSFGKWLANARDWSISRNRFWGSPIPVWKSDDPRYPRLDVYGSLDEMAVDFGVRPVDLHRPAVDDLVRPNPDDPTGKSMMRRVPEVLDCWFESGSMPFAQVHYPFENQEWFDNHYPGDFIVEYIGQTRGWFYTLHVLATALFDRPSFQTCVSHGIVLGSDGAKMSKSLKNYPDPYAMFDSYGSDAMRWALLSSPILRGTDLIVTEPLIRDAVRQSILPLWNAYSFFTLYANAGNVTANPIDASALTDPLDRYIVSKLHDLVVEVTAEMDAYDFFDACAAIRSFLETLTNWYIRRSRDRFWSADQTAVDVLHLVLSTVCRLAAPLLPLTAEAVYVGLNGAGSVHLTDWPDAEAFPANTVLVGGMDRTRDVCSAASSVRKAAGLRNRLPLASLTVSASHAASLAPFADIIRDELNVKAVHTDDLGSAGTFVLNVVPGVLGPRIGGQVQQVIKAVKTGDWQRDGDTVTAGGVSLLPGEYSLKLVPADEGRSATLAGDRGVVLLDTAVTPELEAEGLARDLIRAIQQARREADLHVSDRIDFELTGTAEMIAALGAHRSMVLAETLASSATTTLDPEATDPRIAVRTSR